MNNLIWIGLIIIGVVKYINKRAKKFEENRPKRQQGGTTSAFPAQVTPVKQEDMTNGTASTKTEIDARRSLQRENRAQRRADREDVKTDNRDSSYQGQLTMSEMKPGRDYASSSQNESSMPPPLPQDTQEATVEASRQPDIFDVLFPHMPRPERPQGLERALQPAEVTPSSPPREETQRPHKVKTALEQYEEKYMSKDHYAKKKHSGNSSHSSFEFIGNSEGRVMDLDLDDPINVRRAIVYSEIFKRKYE